MRFLKILLLVLVLCGASDVWAKKEKDEPKSPAEKAFEAGELAYERKQYQNAIYAFQRATQYDPENYESYCMLGLMYLLNNETERGLNMLTYATQTFPKQGYAFALLGDYYHTQNKVDLALKNYQQAIDLKLPREQKTTYKNRLEDLVARQKEKMNLNTSAASKIIHSVQLNAESEWTVDHAESTENHWMITYKYQDEDLLSNKWTQKVTLTCQLNKVGKKPFKELFSDIVDSYLKRDISIANIDHGFRTGSFTTSHIDTRSVVYTFINERDLCIAEREKRERWLINEPVVWLETLKRIKINTEAQ